jgi:hypothetical protein
VKKDCPSQWAYLVTEDGGYISASDVEEDDEEDGTDDVEECVIHGGETSSGHLNIIYSVCSACKSSNLRGCNATTCSRLSSSSRTDARV